MALFELEASIMPRMCTVCTHPKIATVNEALVKRTGSLRDIAGRFVIGRSSLHRHAQTCLSQELASGFERLRAGESSRHASLAVKAEIARLMSAQELFEKLQSLVDDALGLLGDAKRDGDRPNALKALREARETLALLGKTQGYWADGPSTVVDARRQQIQIFSGLTEAELRSLAALDDASTDGSALPAALGGKAS